MNDTLKTLAGSGLRALVIIATGKDGKEARVVMSRAQYGNETIAQLTSEALHAILKAKGAGWMDSFRVSRIAQ